MQENIRAVTLEDKNQILDMLFAFPESVRDNLRLELSQAINGTIEGLNGYVATEEGLICGYIVLRKWGGVYHLDTTVVAEAFQGRGIGGRLVEFAKQKCISENVLQLNVCTFYTTHISFYERCGFVFMGKLEGPFVPLDKERIYLKWTNKNRNM